MSSGTGLGLPPKPVFRDQDYTMTAIKIVAIHFEQNVRIWIGLELTSTRRYYGSAYSAHRTRPV
jgi:hypothetical protein